MRNVLNPLDRSISYIRGVRFVSSPKLRISYSDHFLSVVCGCMPASICLFTFSEDFSSEAAHPILLRLGEQKIAKMVAIH